MDNRLRFGVLAALVVVACAVKVPYARGQFRIYSDAIAYTNIAHNWAAGNGFTSTLRLNYFDPAPVEHFALADWPPGYPLLAGVLVNAGVSDGGLQVVNALFAALAAALVMLLAERLFGFAAGVVSGIMVAFALNLFRSSLLAMSDALGLVLALAAVVAALSAGPCSISDAAGARKARNIAWPWFAAGALAGVAYVTRFSNAVLMIAFVPYVLLNRRERWAVLPCLAGFGLAAGPVLIWKWAVYGSPFYGVQALHYATSSFRDSSWQWNPEPAGTVASVPISHILSAIWRNARYFATTLFRSPIGLHLLSMALPVGLIARREVAISRRSLLVLTVALLAFGIHACTWSLPAAQGGRFMLLPFCLLMPYCGAGIAWLLRTRNYGTRIAAAVLCAMALHSYVIGYPGSAKRAAQFPPLDPAAVALIKRTLGPRTIVASNNPWLVSYHTGLASTALPHNLDAESLPRFIDRYHVGAFVVIDGGAKSPTIQTIDAQPGRFVSSEAGKVQVLIPKQARPAD